MLSCPKCKCSHYEMTDDLKFLHCSACGHQFDPKRQIFLAELPPVSIAMATYNGAAFLREQLESLAKQTILPVELIITDDNSTDDTQTIVEAFASCSPFPVQFTKNAERLGYRGNFMKAANLCKADYIAFCDQDDVWLPEKLEKCLAAFTTPNVLLAYHNATIVDVALRPTGQTMSASAAPQAINPQQTIEPWQFGWGLTIVFHRSLLAHNKLWEKSSDFHKPDEREAHDQWVFFLASNLGSIVYISDPLLLYRQHGKNAYGWTTNSYIGNKIARLRNADAQEFKNYMIAAEHRADTLDKLKLLRAANGYRILQNFYQLRIRMYEAQGPLRRFLQLGELLKIGAYKSKNEWGLGSKAFILDIARGFFNPYQQPHEAP